MPTPKPDGRGMRPEVGLPRWCGLCPTNGYHDPEKCPGRAAPAPVIPEEAVRVVIQAMHRAGFMSDTTMMAQTVYGALYPAIRAHVLAEERERVMKRAETIALWKLVDDGSGYTYPEIRSVRAIVAEAIAADRGEPS